MLVLRLLAHRLEVLPELPLPLELPELVLVELSGGGAQRRLIRQPPPDLAAAIERLTAGPTTP
jgi:hypothetical protein